MSYVMKAEDVHGLAQSLSIKTKVKGDELWFRHCPKCKGGGGDLETFSVNLTTGAFKCFRASCGYSGHFVELCRDFGYQLDDGRPRFYRELRQPDEIVIRDAAIRYMEGRGISRETCERYQVTVHKNQPNVLVFPFYDETNRLRFIKYRKMNWHKGMSGGKEWSEKDTMPILFGMKQCNGFERLVITEGQMDSLSCAEAGIANAVSVPTGATGFTWLDNCWDWVTKFKEVVVFGDNEHGKITLLDTIRARLPSSIRVLCVRPIDYLGEKDANDILRKHGAENVRKAVENAEIPKMRNVKELSSVRSVNINDLERLKTGIPELDKTIGGLVMGQVVLLSGKRGEGKSTFGSQLMVSALDQGASIFAYSGELADFHFKRWIDYQLAGLDALEEVKMDNGEITYSIRPEAVERITEWYRHRAFIYDNEYVPDDKEELEALTDTVEKVIQQYGCKLIFIDNLMTSMEFVQEQSNLYLEQSKFVGRLKKLAMKYQVVVILVAHPRKSKEGFSNDDVSGSSDITNKVDVVLSYSRMPEGSPVDSRLEISKNRLFGKLKMGSEGIGLMYSDKTKRIYSPKDTFQRRYGWTKQATYLPVDEADMPF